MPLMTSNILKQIAVSVENYQRLQKLGQFGESFNDVVTKLLEKEETKRKWQKKNRRWR